MNLDDLCAALKEAQRERAFCIKSQSRCDRSVESYIAMGLGFHNDLSEGERKKIFDMAKRIRERGEKVEDWEIDEALHPYAAVAHIVHDSARAREVWDLHRRGIEGRMKELAKETPAWAFVKTVKGVDALGLAVIVGEAGYSLANFTRPAKLWKRMGLAVIDGKRQGKPGAEASKDDWVAHGYNPRRRAEMWAFFSDSMFKHQWRGDKDEDGKDAKKTKKPVAIPAHAIGPYGEVYGRAYAKYIAREKPPAHANNHARRVMTKALLVDIWRAWRANAVVDIPSDRSEYYRLQLAAE